MTATGGEVARRRSAWRTAGSRARRCRSPSATEKATAVSTATSGGRSRSGIADRAAHGSAEPCGRVGRHGTARPPAVSVGAGAGRGQPHGAAGAQVVADDVLAEPVGVGGEHPAAVAPGDLVDEAAQPRVVAEHEDVERGAAPGQPVDLGEGGPQRLRRRRPVEDGLAVARQVRGRLAVGDHQDDRLGVGVPSQVPAGQHQRVLQVGALHHVAVERRPARCGCSGRA